VFSPSIVSLVSSQNNSSGASALSGARLFRVAASAYGPNRDARDGASDEQEAVQPPRLRRRSQIATVRRSGVIATSAKARAGSGRRISMEWPSARARAWRRVGSTTSRKSRRPSLSHQRLGWCKVAQTKKYPSRKLSRPSRRCGPQAAHLGKARPCFLP